jgi:deoxyadenosine/deoxycytidine kinase
MSHFIAIAGNIGVGKTTLTKKLAERLSIKAILEEPKTNPYRHDCLNNPEKWGFHSLFYYLSYYLARSLSLFHTGETVIQDRCFYENAEVFAKNFFLSGSISEQEWQTYQEIYRSLTALLPPPHLIIYLSASVPTLMKRIAHRAREHENNISPSYLSQLNTLYEEWTGGFTLAPILRVNTDTFNPISDNDTFERLKDRILKEIESERSVTQSAFA